MASIILAIIPVRIVSFPIIIPDACVPAIGVVIFFAAVCIVVIVAFLRIWPVPRGGKGLGILCAAFQLQREPRTLSPNTVRQREGMRVVEL